MKINYSFEKRNFYIYLTLTGNFNMNEVLSFGGIIKEKCHEENTYKILVDSLELEQMNLSTTDRFRIGEKVASEFGSAFKMASVIKKENIDSNNFGDIVALNRGANFKSFDDIESAKAWLL